MTWFATVLAHLLMLFLVIAIPIRGAQRYKVLMRRLTHHPELRVQFYLRGMFSQWLMLIPLLVIAIGLGWPASLLGLQSPNTLVLPLIVAILIIGVVYAQVFYIRRVSRTVEGRLQLRQSMSGPLLMLPRTGKEQALWILLSLTAGFCEELLYRGFMPAYLVNIFPHVNLLFAIIIAAALFGIGHVYQKLTGVLGTGIMGLLFGLLYFFTGSLFLPMIVHALFDMRLLLIDISGIMDTSDETSQATSLS